MVTMVHGDHLGCLLAAPSTQSGKIERVPSLFAGGRPLFNTESPMVTVAMVESIPVAHTFDGAVAHAAADPRLNRGRPRKRTRRRVYSNLAAR